MPDPKGGTGELPDYRKGAAQFNGLSGKLEKSLVLSQGIANALFHAKRVLLFCKQFVNCCRTIENPIDKVGVFGV